MPEFSVGDTTLNRIEATGILQHEQMQNGEQLSPVSESEGASKWAEAVMLCPWLSNCAITSSHG